MNDYPDIISLLLLGISVYLTLFGGVQKLVAVLRARKFTPSEAAVTGVRSGRYNGAYRKIADVSYTYGDRTYEQPLQMTPFSAEFTVGERLPVLIDPAHPARVCTADLSFERLAGWVNLIIGVFCFVVLIIRIV